MNSKLLKIQVTLKSVLLTIQSIYARIRGFQTKPNIMDKKEPNLIDEQQEVMDIVDWCLERSENLNEMDSLALLEEFDDWIMFQAEEIDTIDVTRITTES